MEKKSDREIFMDFLNTLNALAEVIKENNKPEQAEICQWPGITFRIDYRSNESC